MIGAGAIRRPVHKRSIRGGADTDPLPDIVGRLARLEAAEFSYDDLLLDFASRRHLNPVKGRPEVGRSATDPAQEADEIVQAYLSPTHNVIFSTSSTTRASDHSIRAPCALRDSRAVNVVQRQQQPHEHAAQKVGIPRFWHEIHSRFEKSAGEGGGRGHVEGTLLSSRKGDAVSLIENVESPRNESDLHVLAYRPSRPTPGDSGIALDPRAVQTKGHDNLEGSIVTRKEIRMPLRQREGSEARPRPSSLGSHPEQDSLNWYPSRPASAEASVSLISPRTSKKIRRLPTPGQIEEETLQRVERAVKTFSTQALGLSKRGGLYSTLGRSDVGFIETDIHDLTATITGRTGDPGAAKRGAIVDISSKRKDGVLAQLLGPKKKILLPTVHPAPFYDMSMSRPGTREGTSSRVSTPGSPSRPPFPRKPVGQTNKNDDAVFFNDCIVNENPSEQEGLEGSRRFAVRGADGRQHGTHVDANVRRLRALLGERFQGDVGRPKSPSLFSVDELRVLGAAKQRRRWAEERSGSDSQGGGEADIEWVSKRREEKQGQGGVTAELSENVMLRNLATALMSSVQCRVQREFLLLGFRKWKAVMAQGTLLKYLDAAVLIQSSLRRTLAVMEASERRRLRDHQRQKREEQCRALGCGVDKNQRLS